MRRLLLVCLLISNACGSRTPPAPQAVFTKDELTAAREAMATARVAARERPASIFRESIQVDPFGSLLHANVQVFFNREGKRVAACAADSADPTAVDVIVRYAPGERPAVAAFGADLTRDARAEQCLFALFTGEGSPIARPVAAGRLTFWPAAFAGTAW